MQEKENLRVGVGIRGAVIRIFTDRKQTGSKSTSGFSAPGLQKAILDAFWGHNGKSVAGHPESRSTGHTGVSEELKTNWARV